MTKLVIFICILSFLFSCFQKKEILNTEVSTLKEGSMFPNIFTNNNEAIVSWIEEIEDTTFLKIGKLENNQIHAQTLVARGTDWFVNWADFPDVALFKNGKYIVNWLEKSSSSTYDYNVKIAIGKIGSNSIDTSFILHNDGVNAEHGFVSFAPYKDKVMAVWLDGRNTKTVLAGHGDMSFRSAIIDSNGGITERVLIDSMVCDCCQTDLYVNGSQAYVVYRNKSHDNIRDNYISFYNNGAWSEGIPIHENHWKIAGCPVNGPSITGRDSLLILAWYTEEGDLPLGQFLGMNTDGKILFGPKTFSSSGAMGRIDLTRSIDQESFIISYMEKGEEESANMIIKTMDLEGNITNKRIIGSNKSNRSTGFPRMGTTDENTYLVYTNKVGTTQGELIILE